MIISRIIGGLGNQMYQYACGLAVARHHRVPFFLDLRDFRDYPLRNFLLDNFNITAGTSEGDHLPATARVRSPFVRLLPGLFRPRGLRVYRERTMTFDPRVFDQGNNLYLDGYWQSEKYFLPVADQIRREFTLRQPLDEANQRLVDQIRTEDAISLHVRRGDYVNHPLYATCSLQYYHAALERITAKYPTATVYVFSDDPDWVKANISSSLPTQYITNNRDAHDYKDLVVMSACRHHIIANSSFSWWGAWLGFDAQGIVIAPETWYTEPSKDTRDLLPAAWIRLPN